MAVIDDALSSEFLILSSAGSHANQEWQTIIDRKRRDIARTKHTVWVVNSQAAAPQTVQAVCNRNGARHVIFLARMRDKPGANTSHDDPAVAYSADGRSWSPLDRELSEVTGRINRVTTGLWLDRLDQVGAGKLTLAPFVQTDDSTPLTGFSNISSTYPVRRIAVATLQTLGDYHVLGVGRLGSPFAVWLRK